MALLFERLLESASASPRRRDGREAAAHAGRLARKDVAALQRALRKTGRAGWVAGQERDALFHRSTPRLISKMMPK